MIKSLIKKTYHYVILFSFSLAYCFIGFNLSFENLILSILAVLGTSVGLGFYLYFAHYFDWVKKYITKLELDYVKRENIITKVYNYFYGFNEKYSEKYHAYSKMLGNGVKLPVANSIINFAYELTPNDTIFLIRVDQSTNMYYMKVAGNTIHYDLAKDVFERMKGQCDSLASDDFIIWKEKRVEN